MASWASTYNKWRQLAVRLSRPQRLDQRRKDLEGARSIEVARLGKASSAMGGATQLRRFLRGAELLDAAISIIDGEKSREEGTRRDCYRPYRQRHFAGFKSAALGCR
jgi:hypothetical protein